MATALLYMVTGGVLFAFGLMAIFARRNTVVRVIGANIMASGVFLVIVTAASTGGAKDADPVAQALVLTGIVISVSLSGFALGLARRLGEEHVSHRGGPGGDEDDR